MDSREARDPSRREFLTIESIPGIVLAAGAGRRFGANKLLVLLDHQHVVYHALHAALAAPLDPVIMVVGYEHEKVLAALAELRAHPKLRIVHNHQWELGRARSLQLALHALPSSAPGAVVLLGDMPRMTPCLIARVVTAFSRTQKLCFPVYRGSVGRPVALPRELFGEFQKLHNDQSGLEILQKNWEDAVKLELAPSEEETQYDLDTVEDLDNIRAASPSQTRLLRCCNSTAAARGPQTHSVDRA